MMQLRRVSLQVFLHEKLYNITIVLTHTCSLGETKEGGNDDTNAQRGIRSNSFVGSAPYVSPEVLQGKYSIVGPPADLWAFACILYQFVSGLPPFHAQ